MSSGSAGKDQHDGAAHDNDEKEVDAELAEKMRKYPQDFELDYRPQRTFGFAWSGGFASPFVSTKQPMVEQILEVLNLSPASVVMDLGAGDGAVLIDLARRVGCTCIGIELDNALVATARRATEEQGVAPLVSFHAMDMFAIFADESALSASQATVLYLYQLPQALRQLEPHLSAWLAAGAESTRTVCCVTWPLSDAFVGYLDPPDPKVHSRRGFYLYRIGTNGEDA